MEEPSKLMLCVCHETHGRVRLRFRALRRAGADVRILKTALSGQKQFLWSDVRASTGSVIVRFDPDSVDRNTAVKLVADLARAVLARTSSKRDPVLTNRSEPFAGKPRNEFSPLSHGVAVALFSGFLLYGLVRRILFRTPLSQGPFSVTGILAAVSTLPLLRLAWSRRRAGRRKGLFLFLAAGCVLAIGTGEAFTALEILWALSLGMFLENLAADTAKRKVRSLLERPPQIVYLWVDGREHPTALETVRVGDVLRIGRGSRIPVDGTVIEGQGLINEAHITGRPYSEVRGVGDFVYAGTSLDQGELHVRTQAAGSETYLRRMVDLAEIYLNQRTKAEARAEELAGRLTRWGMATTLVTLALTGSLDRSLGVLLLMSCPCATVLAVSTAMAAAVAHAARRGVLIKGGRHLETMLKVDCVCLDKTGTLTSSVPEVVDIVPRSPWIDPKRVLTWAASAETKSTHPFSRALVEAARRQGLSTVAPDRCEDRLAEGVRAEMGPDVLLVGNEAFMVSEGIRCGYFKNKALRYLESGHSVVYVARNGKLQGLLCLSNTVRPEARSVMAWLRRDGVTECHLVSGDAGPVVDSLADALSLDGSAGGLTPLKKAEYVERLVQRCSGVLMVGDGVNDAPAFGKAHLSIAVGAAGSPAALEAADITLPDENLTGLVYVRQLSRRTDLTVERNFWFAHTTNLLGAFLAVSSALTPLWGGTLHVLHTLVILWHSGRLLRWTPPEPDPPKIREGGAGHGRAL